MKRGVGWVLTILRFECTALFAFLLASKMHTAHASNLGLNHVRVRARDKSAEGESISLCKILSIRAHSLV